LAGSNRKPPMGHASICARGILAAMIFAGPHETAFAFEEGSGATKPLPPSWHEEAPAIPRGFDLVAIDEKPPKFADYTIASLITLATLWPIETALAQAETPTFAQAKPPTSVLPTTVSKPKSKSWPRPKQTALKPKEKSSRVTADWWRGLFWLRIR
jgi:hypothetical protein